MERDAFREERLQGCTERIAAASRVADECSRRAKAISDACGDGEISGSDLGRMHAYHRVAGEIREAIGAEEDDAKGGPETIGDIIADADSIFGYDPERYFKERSHAYLRERRVRRGFDDTAVQCVVRDLIRRAYEAAGGEFPHGLDL